MLHCVAVCCSERLVEVGHEQANLLKRQMYGVVNLCVVNLAANKQQILSEVGCIVWYIYISFLRKNLVISEKIQCK